MENLHKGADTRNTLSNRRPAETFELEVAGLRYLCTIGRFSDGTVGEVFLQNHKPGSQSDSNARDAAVAASLALQFGCPLQVLQRALLRDSQGRPSTPLGAAVDAIAEREQS
jgi:hypothetical protein